MDKLINLEKCRTIGDCCFRTEGGQCTLLKSTYFRDRRCHFRKKTREGKNEYDTEQKAIVKAGSSEKRIMIAMLRNDGLTASEIADAIGTSERTVNRHLSLMNIERD